MVSIHRFVFFLFIGVLLLPMTSAHAQLDPRCWEQSQCEKQRENDDIYDTLSDEEVADGFVQTSETTSVCGEKDAAGKTLGFCLPISQTKTNIAFGGKQQYLHIGDYIQTVYQYGIIAAGILSVIMLIAAGFIWITSGGNAERIGAAKKKIAGALMGLVLAGLSYTLLSFLNPALVNFRLPQIWAINKQGLAPTWCRDVKGEKNLAFFASSNADEKTKQQRKAAVSPQTTYDIEPKKAECGNDYFVEGTGALSCIGHACPPNKICFQSVTADTPSCQNARSIGRIHNSDVIAQSLVAKADSFWTSLGTEVLLSDFWAWKWDATGGPQIATVCKNNGDSNIVKKSKTSYHQKINKKDVFVQEFSFNYSDTEVDSWVKKQCGSNDNFLGFVLSVDMNLPNDPVDERHLLGLDESGNAIDLCDMKFRWVECIGDEGNFCADECKKVFTGSPGVNKNLFITKEELLKGLNITIDAKDITVIKNDDDMRKSVYAQFGWVE